VGQLRHTAPPQHGVHPAIVPLLHAFGSPREVYRKLPLTVPKFTSTSTMDAVECNDTSATIRYTLHAGFTPSRLDCEYAQGLFSAVPCMFGLPRAHVEHAARRTGTPRASTG
jgi:hypothetical protein